MQKVLYHILIKSRMMYESALVCSGNKNDGPSDVVKNQYESLINIGIQVDIYAIRGKGVLGYLKNIRPLRNKLKKENYDLIHAHYSLSE